MTKFEFLGDLSRLIADLPREEVEQAMEYYEDYFADAGPEKEQEIIRDFISPAYIAEQLREASLQRQKAAEQSSIQEAEKQAAAARAAAASQKPPVYSRKLAAQAQKNASMATSTGFVTQTPTVKTKSQVMPEASVPASSPAPSPAPSPTLTPAPAQAQVRPQTANGHTSASQTTSIPQNQPSTAAPVPPAMQAQTPTPAQAAASIVTPTPTPAAPDASAPQKTTNNSSMRNSIFRDDTEEDKKKAEEELARRNKTKVDIKSINSTTSKVNKKRSREDLKRNAAMEKANNAERYSSSKKMVIGIILLITCPIWLTLIGIILGVFVLGAGAVVGCIAAGIGCLIASVCSIALTLLSLLSARIATGVFTLGCILFLFAAGCGLCFAGYKLATRVLPGGYFSVKVLLNGIKAKIARLALK